MLSTAEFILLFHFVHDTLIRISAGMDHGCDNILFYSSHNKHMRSQIEVKLTSNWLLSTNVQI